MAKVLNNGRTIEGLPAREVLEDRALPAPLAEAVACWREAVEGLQEPARILREAQRRAQESTTRVRGERERWLQEVREKTREEADALRKAERVSSAAASRLVEALEQHREEVRAVAARLTLEQDERAREALQVLRSALESRERLNPVGNVRADHWQTERTLRTSGGIRGVMGDAEKIVEIFPRAAVEEVQA